MPADSRSKHDRKQSCRFFDMPNYQFIIKLCKIAVSDFVFLYAIQSSNAAATDLNALARNSLLAKSFPEIGNDRSLSQLLF